jgi:hypothetical protein
MKKKMRKFAEGGFSAAQEEWLGGADRTDPYILARMRSAVPDEAKPTSRDFDTTDSQTSSMDLPAVKAPKSVERTVVKTKVEPAKDRDFKPLTNKDEEGNKLPTDVKKPYVAIPKNAAGMQQFRSDAESPVERLFKSMMGSKSQRTTAAEKKMKSGGSVKVSSASKRADGCAIRGKTKGRIV